MGVLYLEALKAYRILGYLMNIVLSYFGKRVFLLDTSVGPVEHRVQRCTEPHSTREHLSRRVRR